MAERGRSRRRRNGLLMFLGDHKGLVITGVLVVVLIGAVVTAKVLAEGAATSETDARAEEVRGLLADATPRDFLAFNAGVKRPGSVAAETRDQPDFVNVKASAEQSFIRFQPDGWWSGFTERCIVAVVRADGVRVTVPKTACVRVPVPGT